MTFQTRIGEKLYDLLIKDYTYKQWQKYPSELDPSVLSRIPIRKDFDTRYVSETGWLFYSITVTLKISFHSSEHRYFANKYQALPKEGYTKFFEKLLDHPNITYKTNVDFFDMKNTTDISSFKSVVYTGPIDNYFEGVLEKLEYRSIEFKIKRHFNMKYFQVSTLKLFYTCMYLTHINIYAFQLHMQHHFSQTLW